MDIKRILRSCNFECMPLISSHEENFAASEDLKFLWKKIESSRIEAKLTIIHNKNDHTTSCTSDDDRKTVIYSILDRFPSILEENQSLKKNSRNLAMSHRLTRLYEREAVFVLFEDVSFTVEVEIYQKE